MKLSTTQLSFSTNDEKFYYDFHLARYNATINIVEKYCKKGTLLDVGAYPFHLLYHFNKNEHYKTIGLDNKPQRKKDFISKNNLSVYKCDIQKDTFPIKDSTVDLVLFSEVFEHLGCDPLFALQEINRVLKKDGIMILTTPNLYSLKNIFSFICGKGIGNPYIEYQKIQKYGHMGHIREYSRSEIQNLLQNTNYKIINKLFTQYKIPTNGKLKTIILTPTLTIFPIFKSSQIFVCQKK